MRILLAILAMAVLTMNGAVYAAASCGGGSGPMLNPTSGGGGGATITGSGGGGGYSQNYAPTTNPNPPSYSIGTIPNTYVPEPVKIAPATAYIPVPTATQAPTVSVREIPSSETTATHLTGGTSTPGSDRHLEGTQPTSQAYNPECECWQNVLLPNGPAQSNTATYAEAAKLLSQDPLKQQLVPWLASLDYAHEFAQQKNEPYVIYFCNETVAKTTGQGPAAMAEFKKTHSGQEARQTIFDNGGVLSAFDAAGISLFVKIPLTSDNAALADTWKAHDNTLIFVAPNGEKLASFNREECTETNVAQYLVEFKEKYKVWKWKTQMDAVRTAGK